MKINEITQPAKIKAVRPGQSAVVDKGDGTELHIDLKKNPSALSKDEQGKVKLSTKPQNGQKKDPAKMLRPGDNVDIADEK